MSIFSRIFGLQPQSGGKVESGSPEIIRIGEFEKELHELLDRDAYLARSDYKPLCAKYEDLFVQFSTLKKSKTLDYYCSQNHADVQQLASFLETFADLNKKESTEIITLHNKAFLEKHLVTDKTYLDNVLKKVDPAINLDEEQRKVVLSDEDYMLVIAGAGAGKTTTVAAKVKYLVENERRERNVVLRSRQTELRNRIYRSYANVKYASLISDREAIEIISDIKWGKNLGFFAGIEDSELCALLYRVQKGHLQFVLKNRKFNFPVDISESKSLKTDYLRALILQEAFENIKLN